MIEKLKNLRWHFQLLILVAIAALLYGSVYYFVTSGTRAETADLMSKVDALKTKNAAAKMATEHITELRALFASKTQEYEELKVLLPEQREITNVLEGLQDTARSSRMIVMRFSPRDDSLQESIMAKPVEIEVDSNFNNLRSFFDSMAKLPRIVSITDFKVNQLEKQTADKTLHAQFLLTAYYAAPEDLIKKAAEAKQGKPGKPGAPATNGQPAAAPAGQPAAPPAQAQPAK
jgi:type IV pilus assembly protein PilO